jgi:molybdopterin converting factor small subunit
MSLNVLFFGATADIAGRRELKIDMPADGTARSAFDEVLLMHPGLASHRLLFSINQKYASGSELLRDGDELAVFTAVSGG